MRLAVRETEEEADPQPEPSRFGGTDIFRGAMVIVLALAVGGFVVSRGLDSNPDDETEAGSVTASTVAAVDGDADATAGEPAAPDAGAAGDGATPADGAAEPGADTAGAAGNDPAAGEGQDTAGASGGTTDSTEAMPDTEPEPDPAPAALRPPAEVRALILNGAQTQGIAARGTEQLKVAGYQTAAPKNATSQQPTSSILYVEGYENEAAAVAQTFGPGLETLIAPYDPAAPPIDDIQGAHVIVIIGGDNVIPIP